MSWVERGIKGKFVCRRASLIRFRSFGVSIVKQLESDFKLLDDGKTLLQASSVSLMIILWTITKLFTASSQFTAVKAVSRTTSWVNLHTHEMKLMTTKIVDFFLLSGCEVSWIYCLIFTSRTCSFGKSSLLSILMCSLRSFFIFE